LELDLGIGRLGLDANGTSAEDEPRGAEDHRDETPQKDFSRSYGSTRTGPCPNGQGLERNRLDEGPGVVEAGERRRSNGRRIGLLWRLPCFGAQACFVTIDTDSELRFTESQDVSIPQPLGRLQWSPVAEHG
jgi:hypothetical protein